MSAKTLKVLKILNCSIKPIVNSSRRANSRYGFNIDPLPTKYGGKTNVTILPGVGIGPEIMESTLKVLEAAQAPLSYEIMIFSTGEEESATNEFENVLTSIRRNRVALKGNIELKSKNPLAKSRNSLLRKTLDLFVYVLCCKSYPGLKNRFKNIDVVVIRQNTEGEYLMLEHEPLPGTAESLKIITRFASERLAKFAFDYALKYDRKLITVMHNASVQKESEGLFVKAALTVSKNYPTIKVNVADVGVVVPTIVMNPQAYDIILATNLNGGMLSNILNGMVGGPGLSAGTNFGEGGLAVFEPGARNKGSSIVGTGTANPIAMIRAAVFHPPITDISILCSSREKSESQDESHREKKFSCLMQPKVHFWPFTWSLALSREKHSTVESDQALSDVNHMAKSKVLVKGKGECLWKAMAFESEKKSKQNRILAQKFSKDKTYEIVRRNDLGKRHSDGKSGSNRLPDREKKNEN